MTTDLSQVIRPAPPPRTKPKVSTLARLRAWTILVVVLGIGFVSVRWAAGALIKLIPTADIHRVQTTTVREGSLKVTVTENGSVESASNFEVKCQVQGGSTILWIIADGTQVTKGTELVRLDSARIEDEINTQKIAYERARATLIQTEQKYSASTVAVKEYLEGTFERDRQIAESNIVLAEEYLKSSENVRDYSEKMFRKGYINELQLESARFSVEKAQLELDAKRTERKVLVEYTKPKMVKELESTRDSTQAQMMADKAAGELEEAKLARLKRQLENCTIEAPQDGMVIYANSGDGRGNNGPEIQEGAAVREFQTLIRLPDLSRMQVKVKVHESKIERIKPGMRATVRIRDRRVQGEVFSVASQPESGGWFSTGVKEYAAIVHLETTEPARGVAMASDQPPPRDVEADQAKVRGIKPGMTAEVTIEVKELNDILYVPMLGVVEIAGKHFAYVQQKEPGKFDKRPVVLGLNNEQFIEIKDGLAKNEVIVLNPRTAIPEARQAAEEEKKESASATSKSSSRKSGAGKMMKQMGPPN